MLINRLFGEVYSFDTNIEVIVNSIVDAGIQLTPFQSMDREAECATAARVGAASEVLCTETFTPRVTGPCGQTILLVVQREVVRPLREIQQPAKLTHFTENLESATGRAVLNRTTTEVLLREVGQHTKT